MTSQQFYVDSPPNVLHSFPKHSIVHQFIEVLREIILCLLPEISVLLDVVSHPRLLSKYQSTMDFDTTYSKLSVEFQVSIMENVLCLVAQVWYKFESI